MDTYEATKTVMSRIQGLDPENASKIMGYILIQDQGEKEMIRLAFSPEALLLSYINEAKARLGLSSNSPSSNPLSYPIMPNNPFPQNSPRIMIPNNAFHLSNPSSPFTIFQRSRPRPIPYTAVQDNSNIVTNNNFGDEFLSGPVVDSIMSPGGRSDSLVFPYGEDANSVSSPHPHLFHKRSCSVNDAAFLSNIEEGGVGNGFLWRPCMYFSRGFCKNGSTCKFVHGDVDPIDAGSPSKTGSGFDELLRVKSLQLQQQRFAFMASGGHHPFAYNKCMDSLNENLSANSSSRQIYLTFPADSTFKEEDVSSYFSMFGPVQDVRIPYQQKRMFGFVTFVYPETVKLILAKGNPHFLCDSRVLVKPYKEKGKFREKKQQERGEYWGCLSPSGVDSGEHFDMPFGSRMMLSPRQMMLRRKLEHDAELQHAIELQGRRMMNLQLMDLKNENNNYHFVQSFPAGVPYSSPRHSQILMNQHSVNREDSEEFDGGQEGDVAADEKLVMDGNESSPINNNIDCGNHQHRGNSDDSDPHQSLDYILPDNLFSSPTKSAAERQHVLTEASPKANDGIPVTSTPSINDPLLPNSSPLTMASLKSCYLQMPRFSSAQKAVEM